MKSSFFEKASQNKRFNDDVFIRVGLALNILQNLRALKEKAGFGVNFAGFHQLGEQRNVRVINKVKMHFTQDLVNLVADVVTLAAEFIF